MSVSQIVSYKPARAALALAIAGLFITQPVVAKTTTSSSKKISSHKSATPAVAKMPSVKLTDIVVKGLQRSDPAAVFGFLPVKVGDEFNPEKSQEIIKALYASGLYEDVSVGLDGSVLVVKLSERDVISDLTIKGMKNFDKKEVLKNLKNYGFAQGYPYDPALLEKVKTEIKAMYEEAGLVNATITSTVNQQDRKQVAVTVVVDEGKYLKIKHINVVGNKGVSSHKIRSIMDLNSNGIFSWYSKDSRFAPERLKSDLEAIRGYYYDKGYLDFDFTKVETPTTPDNRYLDIDLTVVEGEQYHVNSIVLTGDSKGTPRKDLEKFVKYKQGKVFSRSAMSDIARKVSRRLSDDGYALAKVDVVPTLHKDNHTVDVAITIDPAERVYVRHVNVVGNSRTKDNVIRREVRQLESSLYSAEKVQTSRDRIDRLGFFSEVTVDTVPVEGTNNQVDVNYAVKEIPTGSMKLGLGYSSSDKLSLSGSIGENNFMGSGKSLGLDIDTSASSRNLTFTTRNPYMTKDGISSNFSAYYRTYDASKLDLSSVKTDTMGLNLIFGVPISENNRLFFGINPERNNIILDASSPDPYVNYINSHGNVYNTVGLSVGWSSDTRDSGYAPTRGLYQRLQAEVSPLGTAKYYKATYQLQKFTPLSKNVTLAFNTQLDYGRGYGGTPFPFYKNLYAGGLGSVRGYDTSTVGPVSVASTGAVSYLGGSKRAVANLELQFPFPGMMKYRGVRLFVFGDAAGLWGDGQYLNSPECDYSKIMLSGCNGVRYSYGAGVLWQSPIGPLKFSYGMPVNMKAHDKAQHFQFQIGTAF